MNLYRKILGDSLKITWRNKYLWFFGLFAALIGNANEYEIVFSGLGSKSKEGFLLFFSQFVETGIFSKQAMLNIGAATNENLLSLLLLSIIGLLLIALFVFLVWLAIVSQIAIVNNAAKAINKKNHSFQEGALSGMKNFWKVFGLNIIGKFIIALVFILLGLSIIVNAKAAYLIAFLILIPIVIALSFIIKYSVAYIVIYGSNLKDAVKKGWALFINNWLVSLEMAFLLFVATFLAAFAVIIIAGSLNTVFAFLTIMAGKLLPGFSFWLFIIMRSMAILLITIFAGALLTTWQIAAWTGLFIQLTGEGMTSRIMRMLRRQN